MSVSPYKKLKTTNRQWIAYVNLSKLTQGVAYKIWGLTETNHEKYGKGQQATVSTFNGPKYRAQLPGKYLSNMSAEDIKEIKRDTVYGRNPYLIYREQLPDNSYRIDIVEKNATNDNLWEKGLPVPELEDSLSEDIDNGNEGGSGNNGNENGPEGTVNDTDKSG